MWQDAVREVRPLTIVRDGQTKLEPGETERVTTCSFVLDASSSRSLLTDVSGSWRVQPHDLMICALVETISEWNGQDAITLDVEGHGREMISEEVDLLRSVGWFTSVYPLRIECDVTERDESGLLRRVRDTHRDVETGGVSYGALRYSENGGERSLVPSTPVPVLFNYLGMWRNRQRGLLQISEPLSASYGDSNQRPYEWEINAVFFDDCLNVTWEYSSSRFSEKTMNELATAFRQRLRKLVDHCVTVPDAQLTPQDFPSAGIDQDDLDDLLADYGDL